MLVRVVGEGVDALSISSNILATLVRGVSISAGGEPVLCVGDDSMLSFCTLSSALAE